MASLILLLGPSGAGKSVQAERLAERHSWAHIATGQLMREDNDPWVMAEANAGHLAPAEYIENLLFQALRSRIGYDIVLDGYPRELSEARWLEDHLSEFKLEIAKVVFLKVSRSESVARTLKRGRKDDTKESLEQRWDYFDKQVQPVIEHYQQQGKLVAVDGEGSISDVTERIEAVL